MIKKITILLILLNIPLFSYSQESDKVYLKNKEVISGKILNVTPNNIEIDPVGSKPFLIIKRIDAEVIIYSDNTVVNLGNSDNNKLKSIEKKDSHISTQVNPPFPITEEDVLKCVIDTLKNYENFYTDLNYNSDFLVVGSDPFYYTDSKILRLKIKNIKTSYSLSIKNTSISIKYENIWEYSESGKLISRTTYTGDKKNNQLTYKWDLNGNLISTKKYNSGALGLLNSTLLTTSYSHVGDTIIIKEKDKNGRLKNLSMTLKNIRISLNTDYKTVWIDILRKDYNGFERLSYYYDKNNMCKKYIVKYTFIDDKTIKVYKSDKLSKEYFFNKEGLLTEFVNYINLNKKNKYVYKIFYNKKGLVMKTISGSDVRKYSYEFY